MLETVTTEFSAAVTLRKQIWPKIVLNDDPPVVGPDTRRPP